MAKHRLTFDARLMLVSLAGIVKHRRDNCINDHRANIFMSEEDGTADCSHMIFGARWSPEFPVIAPQNAGLERESYPSLGHNSWSDALLSTVPESGNVSAATTIWRWSYFCLGHMPWPERVFPNAFTIALTAELKTALELLLPPTCSDTR